MVEIPLTIRLILAALFGLVFGSLVTALSYRQPRGLSIAKGRSLCPYCVHTLAASDLVPVFSWVLNKGLCRYCGANISWRYPAIEITTATLCVIGMALSTTPEKMWVLLAITPAIMTLAVIDIEHKYLPNGLVLILALLAGAMRWVSDGEVLAGLALASGVVILGLLVDAGYRACMVSEGLGLGNVKLMAVGALALPLEVFIFFLALTTLLSIFFLVVYKCMRPNYEFYFCSTILASFWFCLVAEGFIKTSFVVAFID